MTDRTSQTRLVAVRTLLIAAVITGTGLTVPFLDDIVVVAIALLLLIGVWFVFRRAGERFTSMMVDRWPAAGMAIVCVAVLAVVFGTLEHVTRALRNLRVIELYQPMLTVLPPGTEDWRAAHITADEAREWDPVLWWRPIHRHPFNAQGFKGREVQADARETFRIMSYGDSNTEGPEEGGWTERLQMLLDGHGAGFEVLNAGVTGYSSYQGLRRFEQEAPMFGPDLLFVSFGWNDLATTSGARDSEYVPPSPASTRLQRVLLRFSFYRALLYRQKLREGLPTVAVQSRVSLDEYLQNLDGFRAIANRHGARLVVLTRPHRETADALRTIEGNWRARVPEYNDAARAWCERQPEVALIDVQAHFEALGPDMFIDECHFTEEGHRRMAALLADSLTRNGWLEAASVATR